MWVPLWADHQRRPDTDVSLAVNVKLFRSNLATTIPPADINIFIGVTIYSNNLTMLMHAEQMGTRGASQRAGGGGSPVSTVPLEEASGRSGFPCSLKRTQIFSPRNPADESLGGPAVSHCE